MSALEIFPRGIDQSILIAVWIGVFVLLFLTESIGWVNAGLVVPGYLASVLIFSPAAAAAVMFEGVLTFLIARAISDAFARSFAGVEFFGRDRFFLIVVVSVGVRQGSELFLLPEFARWIDDHWGTTLALDRSLASIGLVLVPLTANCFWKLDLPRGLLQVGVPTAITYLIVAFVLLPWTNLSYAHHELTYEDGALDFLGSPKSYLILLTSAYLASRFNLDYGWDYNGILVPGLLALTWFEPTRVLSTLIEALILLFLAKRVVRLPKIRSLNLEGPRRVAMVFTLSVMVRALLAFTIGERSPNVHAYDVFGFGYLLSSLLAAKMIQAKAIGRVIMPAAQVSLVGFVAGSLVGFAFELAMPSSAAAPHSASDETIVRARVLRERSPENAMARAGARTLFRVPDARVDPYSQLDVEIASALMSDHMDATTNLERAARAQGLGVVVEPSDRGRRGFVLLREDSERLDEVRGFDTVLLRPGATGPLLEVPRPHREPAAMAGAVAMCHRLDCGAIIVRGVELLERPTGDWLTRLADRGARARVRVRVDETMDTPVVRLDGEIAAGVSFSNVLDGVRIEIATDTEADGAAIVWASSARLLSSVPGLVIETESSVHAAERLIEDAFAAQGMNTEFSQPSDLELRHFADFVIAPLFRGAMANEGPSGPNLLLAAYHAAQTGYRVQFLEDGAGRGQPAVLLRELRPGVLRWGACAVRVGPSEPLVLIAPRPTFELGTDRLALRLFRESSGRAVMIGGADMALGESVLQVQFPDSAGPSWQTGGLNTVVLAFHAAAHRALAPRAPDAVLLHVRALGTERGLSDAMIVGLGSPMLHESRVSATLRSLVEDGALAQMRPFRYVTGQADTIGLDGWHEPSVRFSLDLGGAQAAVAWFSVSAREPFMAERSHRLSELAHAADIPATDDNALTFLEPTSLGAPSELSAARHERLQHAMDAVRDAMSLETVHRFRALRSLAGARVVHGYDIATGAPFVALELDLGEAHVARVLAFSARTTGPSVTWHGEGEIEELERACAERASPIVVLGRQRRR